MNAYMHRKYFYPFEGDVGRRQGDRTVMQWSMGFLLERQRDNLRVIEDIKLGLLPGFVASHHTGYWLFKVSKEIHRRQMLALSEGMEALNGESDH